MDNIFKNFRGTDRLKKRKKNYYRRTQGSRDNQETTKQDRLVVQAGVSLIMVGLVFSITKIDTGVTNSLNTKLKSAIESQISFDTLIEAGEGGKNFVISAGKQTGSFISTLINGKDNSNDENTTKPEETETNNSGTTDSEDDDSKNIQTPEVILPEK